MNLEEKNKLLEDEIIKIKEQLKKYTAPTRRKKYYENHKNEILLKNKEALTPEKKREYNLRYYLKKKLEKEETESNKLITK